MSPIDALHSVLIDQFRNAAKTARPGLRSIVAFVLVAEYHEGERVVEVVDGSPASARGKVAEASTEAGELEDDEVGGAPAR